MILNRHGSKSLQLDSCENIMVVLSLSEIGTFGGLLDNYRKGGGFGSLHLGNKLHQLKYI